MFLHFQILLRPLLFLLPWVLLLRRLPLVLLLLRRWVSSKYPTNEYQPT